MKGFIAKLHSKGPSKSGRSPDPSNRRADDESNNAVRSTSSVASTTSGAKIPSQSQDQYLMPHSSSITPIPSHNPTSPSCGGRHITTGIEVSSLTENKPGGKSTAYSTTKMALEVVKEASDVFVPLKSVVGGLSALLHQYDVSSLLLPIRSYIIFIWRGSNSFPIRAMYRGLFFELSCWQLRLPDRHRKTTSGRSRGESTWAGL